MTPGTSTEPLRPGRVLVVDDDPDIRTMLELTLAAEGLDVATAPHGAAALDALTRPGVPTPDVILLDMRMPIMDGWTFASRYRQLPPPHVPIVVLTAAIDARRSAGEIGAAAALGKPFAIEDLLDVLAPYTSPSGDPGSSTPSTPSTPPTPSSTSGV